jgi:arylsulfatase A-like enzyme
LRSCAHLAPEHWSPRPAAPCSPSAGYATAHFGKWHLYGGGPAKHGYDESDGDTDNKTCQPIDAVTGQRSDTSDDPKLMFSLTRRSVGFIERQAKAGRPFFLQVSHYATHARYQATKQTLAKYQKNPLFAKIENQRERLNAPLGAAMVEDLDTAFGQLLRTLDALGLAENTCVVFTTDNGYRLWNESYDPLRGAPTKNSDSKMPVTRPLDGRNIWPALRTRTESPVESYYWAWHGQDAIRTAQWKLHRFFDHFELYDIRKDECETTNVASANPAVVQSLVAKMAVWTGSIGTALSHVPAPMALDAKPAPEGDVLEVTVTVTAEAKPKDRLIVPIASWDGFQQATDWVEFDLASAPGALPRGFFYSPFQGNENKPMQVFFKRGDGIDQFGREQATGPEIRGGAGVWEHRVVGMSSTAPGPLRRHGLIFFGGTPGTYTVYLDNLRIRRADGSTSSLWSNRGQTRTQKILDSATFKNIRVRTVPLSEVPTRS